MTTETGAGKSTWETGFPADEADEPCWECVALDMAAKIQGEPQGVGSAWYWANDCEAGTFACSLDHLVAFFSDSDRLVRKDVYAALVEALTDVMRWWDEGFVWSTPNPPDWEKARKALESARGG